MTTKEVLTQARSLIERPEDWCTGVLSHKGDAPFCALGAVMKVTEKEVPYCRFDPALSPEYNQARGVLHEAVGMDPARYNNSHDHDCVLTMFDVAIERSVAK